MSAHIETPEAIRKHVKFYISIGVALLIFTAITVWVSYHDFSNLFGHHANIIIALIIAIFKAGLVAAFFMHLAAEKPMIYRVLVITVAFVLGLFGLTLWEMREKIFAKPNTEVELFARPPAAPAAAEGAEAHQEGPTPAH
ncbi:MAG: cytochrome C oxidase subunit IV family protein [Verrucomicrobiae bacterium]|nr:cytochrome C oxidase subunit IV family protein [Verrucomicrobiae bacterium]